MSAEGGSAPWGAGAPGSVYLEDLGLDPLDPADDFVEVRYDSRGRTPWADMPALTSDLAGLVIDRLRFDDEVLAWVSQALRVSHGDEKQHHEEARRRLLAEYDRLQNRIDAMYVDKLDGRIDTDFFDRKAAGWREEQRKCLALIREHQDANQTYLDEGIRLLELAQKAGALFRKQCPAEKR